MTPSLLRWERRVAARTEGGTEGSSQGGGGEDDDGDGGDGDEGEGRSNRTEFWCRRDCTMGVGGFDVRSRRYDSTHARRSESRFASACCSTAVRGGAKEAEEPAAEAMTSVARGIPRGVPGAAAMNERKAQKLIDETTTTTTED